jgi:DNA-directed RNA polymerase subunit alpha
MDIIKNEPYMPTEIEVNKISKTEATISAYPFEAGYAITLAHPLRRLLMASTVGYAPIAIKIDGVSHEFDSVKGMLENISKFILNLKNVRFRIKDGSD